MTRRTLSTDQPIDDLMEVADIPSSLELSRRLRRSSSYGGKMRARGDAIGLGTLAKTAEALGYDLELAVVPHGEPAGLPDDTPNLWCPECGTTFRAPKAGAKCPSCGNTDEIEVQG